MTATADTKSLVKEITLSATFARLVAFVTVP